ncbi:MAG: succinyl-diaminopimelate desuccinylase [Pseudomonadota bacterium]|jgi:succinyl-diaminopimelate desuccinylase
MSSNIEDTRRRVVELTQELVRRSKPSGDDNGGQQLLAERLKQLGFRCENVPIENCDNLLAVRGAGPEYFAFSGHTDVVPPGPGWSVDPFQGVEVDDRLIGRGVADMKGSVAAWIIALEDFINAYPDTPLPIAVLIAGDEEIISKGTSALLEKFYASGLKIRSCLVGEPSASVRLGDCIRVGRRGSLSAKVRVVGVQGHVAYPHLAKNPIHAACRIVSRLVSIDFDHGLPEVPQSSGDEGWPASSLQCSEIQSGVGGATNVIPGEALFRFNIRFRPPLTREILIAKLMPILEDPDVNIEVDWSGGSRAYDSQPGQLRELLYGMLTEAGFKPRVARDGGTSDGRFVAEYGAEVVEFGPCNQTIHKVDEGLEIAELTDLVGAYSQLLQRVAKTWRS